jgi:Ni/Co efflux regulator RcnB
MDRSLVRRRHTVRKLLAALMFVVALSFCAPAAVMAASGPTPALDAQKDGDKDDQNKPRRHHRHHKKHHHKRHHKKPETTTTTNS